MGEREEKRKNFVEGKNRLKRRRKRGEIFGLAKQNIFWRRKEKYSVVGYKRNGEGKYLEMEKIFWEGEQNDNNININSD